MSQKKSHKEKKNNRSEKVNFAATTKFKLHSVTAGLVTTLKDSMIRFLSAHLERE